jgi:hypothetical protein
MKTYVSEMEISRKDFDRINKLMQVDFNDIDENGDLTEEMQSLVDELDARPDTMPYGFCFEFDNESKIYIDICSGSSNYYDNCQWVSGDCKSDYLFDCDYSIDEEMEFHPTDDDVYICKFIIKED